MRQFLPIFFQVFFGIFFGPSVDGQELALEHYRVGKEIIFSTLYGQILQDEKGYIWFGTDQGLHRYDGQAFVHFPIGPAVLDEEILYINFTDDGTLWGINLNRQVLQLSPDSDTFHLSPIHPSIELSGKELTHTIGQNLYFFGPRMGDKRATCIDFHVDPEQMDRSSFRKVVFDSEVSEVHLRADGTEYLVRIALGKKFNLTKRKDGQEVSLLKFTSPRPIRVRPRLRYLESSQLMALYTLYNTGAPLHLTETKPPFNHYKIPLDQYDFEGINLLVEDSAQNIWICTNNGFFGFDANRKPLLGGRQILAGHIINNLYQDIEGAYWIGTSKNGLYYIPNLGAQYFSSDNSDLLFDHITTLTKDKSGKLYGGTLPSYLFQFDKQG
ncbi:MAG: hypothetical protein AAF985_02300, partial [Bacteroidota bacterium]